MNRNDLLHKRATLVGKLKEYEAQPAAVREHQDMRACIDLTKQELGEVTANLAHIEQLSGGPRNSAEDGRFLNSMVNEVSGFTLSGDAPTQSNGHRGRSGLAEALKHATEEQREQVTELASYLRRGVTALSNLSPASDGGVLIPSFVASALERNYSQFSPVRDNARIWGTDTGADEVFPVLSDSEVGEQVAPAALTGADATVSGDTPPTALTGPTMKAWKISSKPVYIPRETFTDSDINIVEEVLGALLARITRFENLKYTKGVGTTEAEGFLYESSNYEGFDTLDLDVCLDLAYSVPQLYRPNGKYMMSDSTAKYLRKLVTGISGDKRKLWADADFTKGTPPTLHGYPVVINNDMTDVTTNGLYSGGLNSPIAFGDFSKFVVREAEQGRPFVYRYPVPAKDGSGLIAFRRSDSRLIVPVAVAKLNPSGS